MVSWWTLAAMVVLVAVPAAAACPSDDGHDVTPQLALEFPQDKACSRQTPEGCPALPQADEPIVVKGELVWSWTLDACASSFAPSASPIHVSFQSLEGHAHGWLAITTEPREIVIQPQDQWDVSDDVVDPGSGQYEAMERYPVTVSINLVGEPSPDALQALRDTGAVPLMLKASAEATPAFQQAFALEQFTLDGRSAEPVHHGNDVPALPAVSILAAVAFAAFVRRRD